MAVHIFNCAVDAPDSTPFGMPEDLTYNDMESIVEIIVEQVLGYDNAFPEYDDPDTDGTSAVKAQKHLDLYDLPLRLIFLKNQSILAANPAKLISATEQYFNQFFGSPPAPPPWLA